MNPCRVAYLNPSAAVGGAERALLLLLRGLPPERFDPVVLVPGQGALTELLDRQAVPWRIARLAGMEQLTRQGRTSLFSATRGMAGAVAAVRELRRELRAVQPHLLHTNGMKAHVLGAVAGAGLRLPVVWHMRDLTEPGGLRRLLGAMGGCFPRRILAVSRAVSDQFRGHPAYGRVTILHDALDPEHARAAAAAAEIRASLGVPPGRFVAVMVAHFTPWKGHRVFVEALALARGRGLDIHGILVGGSIYSAAAHAGCEAETRRRAEELGLSRCVSFTGCQERSADFIAAGDVLVHPPTAPEPFGLAVIEAMALGLPVIASAAGGILETVTPDDAGAGTGILTPPGDAPAVAAALLDLAGEPQRRRRLGAAGARRVAEHFGPERLYRDLHAIYGEVIPS